MSTGKNELAVQVATPLPQEFGCDVRTSITHVDVYPHTQKPWIQKVPSEGCREIEDVKVTFRSVKDPFLNKCQKTVVVYTLQDTDEGDWQFSDAGLAAEKGQKPLPYDLSLDISLDRKTLYLTMDNVPSHVDEKGNIIYNFVKFRFVAMLFKGQQDLPSKAEVYVSQDPGAGGGRD